MNLPPYISRTPPPLNETEDDEDEEFGTFAVCSDLGEEVCDVFDKTSHIKSEDNVSEDSGFCMNSVGQTQSPCDISPLSSSFNKGNESMSIDNHEDIVLNSSNKETEPNKVEIKTNDSCHDQSTFIQDFERFQSEDYVNSSETLTMPEFSNTFQDKCFFSGNSEASISRVDLVEEISVFAYMPNNLLNNVTVPKPESCNQIVNDGSLDKVLETNHINDTEISTCDHSCSLKKQSKILMKNDLVINKELKLRQEDFHEDLEMNITILQNPVLSFSSCSEQTAKCVYDESVNKGDFVVDDGWDSIDDEFSDFAGFQSIESLPVALKHGSQLQYISEESYTIQDVTDSITETLYSAVESSIVWNSLMCFEETPAFKYQWSTSNTQMKFLQALQIDSRNILYGPWNKMNKFNWTDVPCSFDSTNCSSGSTFTSVTTRNKVLLQETIPDAHFDWINSGLVNPLQGSRDGKGTPSLEEISVSKPLVTRSKDVLNSIPKLTFLKSTYINFK